MVECTTILFGNRIQPAFVMIFTFLLLCSLAWSDTISAKNLVQRDRKVLREEDLEMFKHADKAYMDVNLDDEQMPLSCNGIYPGVTSSSEDMDDILRNISCYWNNLRKKPKQQNIETVKSRPTTYDDDDEKPSPKKSQNFDFGNKEDGEVLLQTLTGSYKYGEARDIEVTLWCKALNNSILKRAQIESENDAKEATAEMVQGGVNEKYMEILVKAKSATLFEHKTSFYGIKESKQVF